MTDHRTHQTILLLNTLQDTLPAPTTWTGNLQQRSTLPGPAPSRWEPCTTCKGDGTIPDKFKRLHPCTICAGHGRYKIDDYTGQRINTAESGILTHRTTVKCDRCAGDGVWKFKRCELCEGTGRRTATTRELSTTHERTRATDDRNLWGRNGSYHELDHNLQQLRQIQRRAYLQVWRVHVDHTLDPDKAPLLELSLVFIVERMPNPILVPAGLSTNEKRAREHRLTLKGRHTDPRARAARNAEIRKLHRHGKPVQWIAQQSGLSVSSVYDILSDREHAAA